jgi:hypothetical protein
MSNMELSHSNRKKQLINCIVHVVCSIASFLCFKYIFKITIFFNFLFVLEILCSVVNLIVFIHLDKMPLKIMKGILVSNKLSNACDETFGALVYFFWFIQYLRNNFSWYIIHLRVFDFLPEIGGLAFVYYLICRLLSCYHNRITKYLNTCYLNI